MSPTYQAVTDCTLATEVYGRSEPIGFMRVFRPSEPGSKGTVAAEKKDPHDGQRKSGDRSISSSTSGEIKREPRGKAAARRNDELDHRDDLIQRSASTHWDLISHVFDLPLWHCIHHCGSDDRRRQRVHRYAGAGYFFALNFGHCDHRCLRCRVSKHSRVAFFAGDRGDVEQSAVPPLYHLWQDRLGSVVRAKKVDPEYTFYVFRICFIAPEVSFSGYSGRIH